MAETIRCGECNKQLRVPAEMLGKRVKCPACGATFVAAAGEPVEPLPEEERPRPTRQPAPPSEEEEYDEEAPRSRRRQPLPDEEEEEEYAERRPRRSAALALSSIKAPAICLLVTGILGILANLYGLANAAIRGPMAVGGVPANVAQMDPQQREMYMKIMNIAQGAGAMAIAMNVIFLLMSSIVTTGGVMMLLGKMHWLAVTGSILAMLNLQCCCCIPGLGFGIWSLVMLLKPEVKSAFR